MSNNETNACPAQSGSFKKELAKVAVSTTVVSAASTFGMLVGMMAFGAVLKTAQRRRKERLDSDTEETLTEE